MDKQFKIKPLKEVTIQSNKLSDEIKRDYKIQTVLIVIVSILALIICFKSMKLAIDYEALKKEKQVLEDYDYIEIENMREGENVE